MNKSRFYALVPIGAIVAALVFFLAPQTGPTNASASPGTLKGLSVTVTQPTTTSSTRAFGVASQSDLVLSNMTETTLPRYRPTTTTTTTTTIATEPEGGDSSKKSSPPTTQANSTTSSTQVTTTTIQAGYRDDYANQFVSSINGLRSSNGRATLTRSGALDAEAKAWAEYMGSSGSLSHSNVGRLIPPWSAVAENVGAGGSVSSVFSLLAGSSGHRDNILGDYTHVGAGVWMDQNGKIWTVHLFAR
ncbi:MAG: CAP domain-containing protein [Actinobacteria bacterium]|nr:CAP domain-containing protein [Actinomycetota bacterium]